MRYDGEQTLLMLIQLAEQFSSQLDALYILHEDPEDLFRIFHSYYKMQQAAGGRVHNAEGKLLMIYRRKRWDLPKGKIDRGETAEQAAVREVEEECGVNQLRIIRPLPSTWHTFIHHTERILKHTHWFEMSCADTRPLVPQTEEDIEQAVWANAAEQKMHRGLLYPSLVDVLDA